MTCLRDLLTATLAALAAAAIAEALGAYGDRLRMPDGTVVRARLSEADEARLLGAES